jgi:hypothetical protein
VINRVNSLGLRRLITPGDLGTGGQGNEVNWIVKGIGVPR